MTMSVQWERAASLVKRLPPVGPRPQAEFDDIVALLEEPTALFGPPSSKREGENFGAVQVTDWRRTVEDLHRILRRHGAHYSHAIQMLQIAAQVLREYGLQLRDCPPSVSFTPPDIGTPAMRYELQIEAPWKLGMEVSDAYLWRVIDMDLHVPGFRISFKGRWEGPPEDEEQGEEALAGTDLDEDEYGEEGVNDDDIVQGPA